GQSRKRGGRDGDLASAGADRSGGLTGSLSGAGGRPPAGHPGAAALALPAGGTTPARGETARSRGGTPGPPPAREGKGFSVLMAGRIHADVAAPAIRIEEALRHRLIGLEAVAGPAHGAGRRRRAIGGLPARRAADPVHAPRRGARAARVRRARGHPMPVGLADAVITDVR